MKKNEIHPLKKYLIQNSIPITDFANELNITIPYLFHILSYKRYPSRKLALEICKRTNLSADDLIFPPDYKELSNEK
jgi:hypothetical protein